MTAGAPLRGIKFNKNRVIPGVSGKRVPGQARLPNLSNAGAHLTRVPRQPSATLFRERHRQQVRDVQGRFAGGWGIAWQGLEATVDRLIEFENVSKENIKQAAEKLKDDMVSWAKENAPWTDRTGMARQELQGAVVWENEDRFVIFLGHGSDIDYGIWLEVRWGGRYAILLPTVEHFAPELNGRFRVLT